MLPGNENASVIRWKQKDFHHWFSSFFSAKKEKRQKIPAWYGGWQPKVQLTLCCQLCLICVCRMGGNKWCTTPLSQYWTGTLDRHWCVWLTLLSFCALLGYQIYTGIVLEQYCPFTFFNSYTSNTLRALC